MTRSSPDPCWARFAIAAVQVVDLKWPMCKQIKQMIPLITCESPFVQDVCELVLGVDVFDFNSIEQPIKSNSVGSGDVSPCRTSAFNDHLDHCFIEFESINKAS